MDRNITDNTEFDALVERVTADIVNGNLSSARFTLWGADMCKDDIAALTAGVVYALAFEMGGDVAAALQRVKDLVVA